MYTKEDLIQHIREMGVAETDAIMVHSSMKAIGDVEGGADTVVEAFMEYFKNGLLMTPTHTWKTIGTEHPIYDPKKEPACVGIIPNVFMKKEGVLRSLHPTHSIAAYGKDAEKYIKGEENAPTACWPGGCWDRLREIKAKILLLGVTHTRNTYIHSVEERLGLPGRFAHRPFELQIVMPDGSRKDVRMDYYFNSACGGDISARFDMLKQAFYDADAARDVRFGDAACILCEADRVFQVCEKIFSENANFLTEQDCSTCSPCSEKQS